MKNPQRERIIVLSAMISSLRESLSDVKAKLHDAERELDALLSGTDMPEQAPLVERIVRALDAQPAAAFTAEELRATMGDEESAPPITSLRSTLARLETNGKILRAGRGSYQSRNGPAAALHLVSEKTAAG